MGLGKSSEQLLVSIVGCWLCKKREWTLVEMKTNADDTADALKSFKRSPCLNLSPWKKYVFPLFFGATPKVFVMASGVKRVSGVGGAGPLALLAWGVVWGPDVGKTGHHQEAYTTP